MNNHHRMAAAAVDKYADKLMSSRLSDRDQPQPAEPSQFILY